MGKKTKKQISLLRERLQKLRKEVADLRQKGGSSNEIEEFAAQIVRVERELELTTQVFQK